MSPSFRPTEVEKGDLLVVRGVRGQDFGDDYTPWGEHSFDPGTIVRVLKVIPPGSASEGRSEREYAFYVSGPHMGTDDYTQTLTADEFCGRFSKDPADVEAFLNAR